MTPYPRSAGFDTDIGAFIESSSVSSPLGPMASSIINHDAVQGETFLPGQIFVFGGFTLRANLLGHLEQIESYAPGHQVRFGSLNYTADIRGDLIFDGFGPASGVPNSHDEHDLDLLSDSIRDIAPIAAPGHQARFGSLNYTADIRRDLIFDGFEPRPSVPHCLDGHDLALPPDSAQEAALVSL